MVWDDGNIDAESIQQDKISRIKEYKYFGVCINEVNRYVRIHEEQLKIKGEQNAAIMKQSAVGSIVST